MDTREDGVDKTFIDRLFPGEVITGQADPALVQSDIYPEEEVFIRNAVPKRRLEFMAGRLCAKQLLARFGIHNFPVLAGKDHEPLWPPGIVGSISHTERYCGVAIARRADVQSIGLDVERVCRLPRDVCRQICTEQELAWVDSLPLDRQQMGVALVFSAKECLYKCQHTMSGQWLEFHDVAISVNPDTKEFSARFATNNSLGKEPCLGGKYFFHGGCVFTGMTTRNPDKPSPV